MTQMCAFGTFLRIAERPFQGPARVFIADSSGTIVTIRRIPRFAPQAVPTRQGCDFRQARAAADSDCLTLTSRLWLKAFQGDDENDPVLPKRSAP